MLDATKLVDNADIFADVTPFTEYDWEFDFSDFIVHRFEVIEAEYEQSETTESWAVE